MTETATADCPDVTSISAVVEPTIDCPWAATATQTINKYGRSNSSAYPTTGGSAVSTGFIPTGTSHSRPTCSLKELPDSFYLRNSLSGYLLYDPTCGKAVGSPEKADATLFHADNTDEFELGGIPQLSLYYPASSPSDNEEYGAYVQYDGGPIQFFQAGDVPEDGDWYIVTASFSAYLCRLSLITWTLHDLRPRRTVVGTCRLGMVLEKMSA